MTTDTAPPIDAETKALLAGASVATLTTQLFKRGLRNLFLVGVGPLNPAAARFVGQAFTLRYIPAREDLDRLEAFQDPDHPQRKAIETVPPGQVLVMDCRGDTRAACGGDILTTRLMVRGVAALVTDGGLRDTGEIAKLDIPVYCAGPSSPPNLVIHHAVEELNVPIGCAGVPVFPGDVLVGDSEGVVVIPRHLAEEVATDAAAQERQERFLARKVARGAPLRGTYPPNEATLREYEAWRAAGEPDD
jgi:regulator of RNase E activity RraA